MSRPGLSSTGLNAGALDADARDSVTPEPLEDATPDPLEHAAQPDDSPAAQSGEAGRRAGESGEAELAEAQLALGRPELAPEAGGEDEAESEDEFELEAEEAAEAFEDHRAASGLSESLVGGGGRPVRRRRGASAGGDDGDGGDGVGDAAEVPVPAGRQNIVGRLVHFVQGSWRELQRVQWPDRRQVMQATGVVIGFVIVAGVYLGVADFLAGKLVNFILK